MRCQSCGREGPAQSRFCVFCGAARPTPEAVFPTRNAPPPSSEAAAAPRPPAPPPEQPIAGPSSPAAPSASTQRIQAPRYPPSEYREVQRLNGAPYPIPVHQPLASPYAQTQQQQVAPAPYVRPQWQEPPPRKKSPTLWIVLGALLALGCISLVWRFALGPSVTNRAAPTPTAVSATAARATAKPAVATAAPSPTPRPSPTPPPAPTRVPVSLANATNITPPAPGPAGLGKLTIKNGTSRDAVAKLVTGTTDPTTWQTQRFVYVKANETVVFENIRVGTYRLAFMSGVDWDVNARKFLREVSTSQFDETFDFKEEQTERGTRFSTWEVSLNPVAGGTGKTSSVPEGAFGTD